MSNKGSVFIVPHWVLCIVNTVYCVCLVRVSRRVFGKILLLVHSQPHHYVLQLPQAGVFHYCITNYFPLILSLYYNKGIILI